MKKVGIIVVAIFSFLLVGCSSTDKKASLNGKDVNQKVVNNKDLSDKSSNDEKTEEKKEVDTNRVNEFIINEMDLEKNSPFKMGMSIDTVRSISKKNNMKIDSEVEIKSTPSDPHWENKVLNIKHIYLEFNKKNNKLFLIEVLNNSKTSLGLGIGDSIIKMKKLYGTKYTVKNLDNIKIYTYKINNHYFNVYEEDSTGRISGWSIKKS